MEENPKDKELSTIINQFFEKRFPIEDQHFKTKNDFLNFYVDLEVQYTAELKSLLDSIKRIPISKIKIANNTLLENLIMSFDLHPYSDEITKVIKNKYKEIAKQIVQDLKEVKNIEGFVTAYIAKKLKEYTDQFYVTLVQIFKREEFPNFLVSKFVQLIKNKFLTLLSEKDVDVSYFYFSDTIITMIDTYQDIFINKKKFLFNSKTKNECTEDYFLLILLSNNSNLKNTEMKYLSHLIQDFEYFVYMFNLDNLFETKEFDFNYNMNKLIDKYLKEYISITQEEAEKKKKIIVEKILKINSDNIHNILNILISYSLILNYLVTKNKKTGEIEVSMSDNYTSFASTKILLNNTLKNFELILDIEEIQDYTQSVLIRDLFLSKYYFLNERYNIDKIKDMLINNPKNKKLKQISEDFLKGLYTKKHNKVLEFILSRNQAFKDKNVRKINLAPLNPRITSNHCYIFISGFLSENSDHYEEWENMALNLSANNTCYFYNWPGDCLSNAASETIVNFGLTVLNNIAKQKLNSTPEPKDCINNTPYGKNEPKNLDIFDPGKSFIDSSNKAALSGEILALILASKLFFKYQTITLVGFSLGTHVTKHCIKKLYELHYKEHIPCNDIIKDVILIAGATSVIGKEEKFKDIFNKMINGKLINCYSKDDQVLNVLYTGCMKKKPIGNSELLLKGCNNLINIDFTPLHLGHTDYRAKMDLVMNKVDLYI